MTKKKNKSKILWNIAVAIYAKPAMFFYCLKMLWRIFVLRSFSDSNIALKNIYRPIGHQTYEEWLSLFDSIDKSDLERIKKRVTQLKIKPLISIVVYSKKFSNDQLEKFLCSITQQLYPCWNLCIVSDSDIEGKRIANHLQHFNNLSQSVTHIQASQPIDLNNLITSVRGEYVVFLYHACVLAKHALYEIAFAINKNHNLDLIYTDEDRLDANSKRCDPVFKTGWNPIWLLSENYIAQIVFYRVAVLKHCLDATENLNSIAAKHYDLLWRFVEGITPTQVAHLPRILCHVWLDQFPVESAENQFVIQRHLKRRKMEVKIQPHPVANHLLKINFTLPVPLPKIAIVIPTRDRVDLLKTVISCLLDSKQTAYRNFEIIVVDNGSVETQTLAYFSEIEQQPAVKILRLDEPFNWSRLNNFGVKNSQSEYILLLNNDVKPINSDWLDKMVSYMVLPEVGVVGAKLYYPHEAVQHAGVILGVGGVATHPMAHAKRADSGYLQRLIIPQNFLAVTGACMLIRRDLYETLNGFNEEIAVAFNDIDLCVRVIQAGYQIVWTPFAELYHYESASRGNDLDKAKFKRFYREYKYMRKKHRHFLDQDIFLNPNLSLYKGSEICLAFPPTTRKYSL